MFRRQAPEPDVLVDVMPVTAKDAHQLETLNELQRAERVLGKARSCREVAVNFEEEAQATLDAARTAHKKLIS